MTPEHFALWLQGFAELNAQPPTPEQWQSIREHLATVFDKQTPEVKPRIPFPPREQRGGADADPLEHIRRQQREEKPYKLDEHVRITC